MNDETPATPREALAEKLFFASGMDDWGVANDNERAEWLEMADAAIHAAAPLAPLDPVLLARTFHESYERLAPDFGYKTREDSAVPWEDVPPENRALMIATAAAVLERFSPEAEAPTYKVEWGVKFESNRPMEMPDEEKAREFVRKYSVTATAKLMHRRAVGPWVAGEPDA